EGNGPQTVLGQRWGQGKLGMGMAHWLCSALFQTLPAGIRVRSGPRSIMLRLSSSTSRLAARLVWAFHGRPPGERNTQVHPAGSGPAPAARGAVRSGRASGSAARQLQAAEFQVLAE